MPQEPTPDFDVHPEDLPVILGGLRGVRHVSVDDIEGALVVRVFVAPELRDHDHWLSLLGRTVRLLSTSAHGGPVDVSVHIQTE